MTIASPTDALRPNIGIGLVPEDRKTEALFLKLAGKHNASLPVIERFCRFGLIDRARARQTAVDARVRARRGRPPRACGRQSTLSPAAISKRSRIAKWLLAESRILLLFDPTRGIDVGTKHELYVLMRAYAEAGGSILFHSTEIPELVHLCDRVIVLYGGRIVAEIGGDGSDGERDHACRARRRCARGSRRERLGALRPDTTARCATGAGVVLRAPSRPDHRGRCFPALLFGSSTAISAGRSPISM